jgi:hypothetical protein
MFENSNHLYFNTCKNKQVCFQKLFKMDKVELRLEGKIKEKRQIKIIKVRA